MAVLKFRAYYEEDEAIYRDIVIKHSQSFFDLHNAILKSYDFDNKHQATFYRSNDNWQRGREITLEKYDRGYKVEPLIMIHTTIGSEIRDTNQKFIYIYDFEKNWAFHVELINITKEESTRIIYPTTSRVEGIGPQQYGTRSLLGKKFVDIEEKYDLPQNNEGFGEEGGESGGEESTEEYPDEA
ncbi:IS1096 element passenger TnpR family protein [Parafilimonas sp.]|uniref:IS1096 element passenger TnpR family protein n=1 Tax=Parafilimonas sp. TaxID=1969739 RepID=UPI0039E6E8BF